MYHSAQLRVTPVTGWIGKGSTRPQICYGKEKDISRKFGAALAFLNLFKIVQNCTVKRLWLRLGLPNSSEQ